MFCSVDGNKEFTCPPFDSMSYSFFTRTQEMILFYQIPLEISLCMVKSKKCETQSQSHDPVKISKITLIFTKYCYLQKKEVLIKNKTSSSYAQDPCQPPFSL